MAYCITGATGFVGSHLISRLRSADRRIRALVHRSAVLPNDVETVHGDLLVSSSLDDFIHDGDTVIHLAYLRSDQAANLRAAQNLAAVCRQRAARLLHVSTAAVFGQASDRVVTETTIPRPMSEYQTIKLEVEEILAGAFDDARRAVAIVRPTAIFGPGGQNLRKAAKDLKNSSGLLNYLRRSLYGRRRMNLVAIQNVVAGIEHLLSATLADDPRYILSDDDSSSNHYGGIVELLCAELECRNWSLPNIPGLSRLLPPLLRARKAWPLNPDQIFSSDKLRASGYRPAVSFELAVRDYAVWLRATNAL